MKTFFKISAASMAVFFVILAVGTNAAFAATSPTLAGSTSFSILGATTVTCTGATTVTGDVGVAPAAAITGFPVPCTVAPGTTQSNTASAINAQTDNLAVFGALDQPCDHSYPDGQDLTLLSPLGPGVYCSAGSFSLSGILNLTGSGVWIFKMVSALNAASGSSITGGDPCNIWWRVGSTATLGTSASFKGNIFALTSVVLQTSATLNGRALAQTASVTMDANTITGPTCAPAQGTLHIIKHVINDNGGTAVAANATINVTGTNVSSASFAGSEAGVDVTLDAGAYTVTEPVVPAGYLQTGSGDCSGTILAGQTKTCTITNNDIAPQLIVNKVVVNDNTGTKVIADFPLFIDGNLVVSGVASTTSTGLHTVSETGAAGYAATIGGHCAANGTITLALGEIKTCTITNNDIAPVVPPPVSGGAASYVPPLIAVVKVPSPLALPGGPGLVKYTYTVSNIGTLPMTNVTMVGDSCSPITYVSGDLNNDARLEVAETWIYTCSKTVSETHTNIVTATGWANGISATDIANATVVVGVPVVPPLINVTKVPSPLTLPAAGGMVTYTNKVTNPGTVALSNVLLTDDKCASVNYISGDTNSNSKLDTAETWTYTCRMNLTESTTNTVTASGDANGLTARDFAIATVVVTPLATVAVPAPVVPNLPETGTAPAGDSTPWNSLMLAGIIFLAAASAIVVWRKRTV